MRVLCFGAMGFIGGPTAQALTRNGHTVLGVTRSEKSAAALTADEIVPIVADPMKPDTWRSLVKEVDCVIDAAGGDIANICTVIFDAVAEEAKKARPNGPPLSYIYCSGTWVHGDHPNEKYGFTSDRVPLHEPMAITAWRLTHERRALAQISSSLTVNVVRPSLLYGKSGSLTAMWFGSAKSGELVVTSQHGDKARLAMIHTDDLAQLFVLVAEKALMVPGVIFEASGDYPEPISHIMNQIAAVTGAKGPRYVPAEDDFHKALTATNLLRPELGRTLLGWRPKKAPFSESIEMYYKAWLASTEK